MTIFRLRPGAHVLPHVGVTNRRLVLQFPLRGWKGVRFRVHDEWREYAPAHPARSLRPLALLARPAHGDSLRSHSSPLPFPHPRAASPLLFEQVR